MRLTQIKAVRHTSVPLLAALLVSGLARMANADTITVTNTIPTFVTDDTQTALLPFFESAPGFVAGDVLTGVQIEFDATETMTALSITNNAAHPQGFKFTASGEVDPAGSAPGAGSISPVIMNTFGPTVFVLAGHGTVSPIPPPVSTDFNTGLFSVPFSPYDTTGTFSLGFTTLNSTTFTGGGGNLVATQTTNALGTIEAIYTFTPPTTGKVPEPGSIFLLGTGLLFAGSLLRKRYRHA
jgi:hypothetical protein